MSPAPRPTLLRQAELQADARAPPALRPHRYAVRSRLGHSTDDPGPARPVSTLGRRATRPRAREGRGDQRRPRVRDAPGVDARDCRTVGVLAHVDTSPVAPGAGVRPRVCRDYDGTPIMIAGRSERVVCPGQSPLLRERIRHDIVTSDDTTLRAADDKAGIAEIMAATAFLLSHTRSCARCRWRTHGSGSGAWRDGRAGERRPSRPPRDARSRCRRPRALIRGVRYKVAL